MIEKCNFCGDTHETGDGEIFDGRVIKTCPWIPQTVGVFYINPKEWKITLSPDDDLQTMIEQSVLELRSTSFPLMPEKDSKKGISAPFDKTNK